VRLCEAPFSITVKLVAPSYGKEAAPELLTQCLEKQGEDDLLAGKHGPRKCHHACASSRARCHCSISSV